MSRRDYLLLSFKFTIYLLEDKMQLRNCRLIPPYLPPNLAPLVYVKCPSLALVPFSAKAACFPCCTNRPKTIIYLTLLLIPSSLIASVGMPESHCFLKQNLSLIRLSIQSFENDEVLAYDDDCKYLFSEIRFSYQVS